MTRCDARRIRDLLHGIRSRGRHGPVIVRHRGDVLARARRGVIAMHRAKRAARQQRELQEQCARDDGGEAAEKIHGILGWAESPGCSEFTPVARKVRQAGDGIM